MTTRNESISAKRPQLRPTVYIDAVPALRRRPQAALPGRLGRMQRRLQRAVPVLLAAAASVFLSFASLPGVGSAKPHPGKTPVSPSIR